MYRPYLKALSELINKKTKRKTYPTNLDEVGDCYRIQEAKYSPIYFYLFTYEDDNGEYIDRFLTFVTRNQIDGTSCIYPVYSFRDDKFKMIRSRQDLKISKEEFIPYLEEFAEAFRNKILNRCPELSNLKQKLKDEDLKQYIDKHIVGRSSEDIFYRLDKAIEAGDLSLDEFDDCTINKLRITFNLCVHCQSIYTRHEDFWDHKGYFYSEKTGVLYVRDNSTTSAGEENTFKWRIPDYVYYNSNSNVVDITEIITNGFGLNAQFNRIPNDAEEISKSAFFEIFDKRWNWFIHEEAANGFPSLREWLEFNNLIPMIGLD